MLLTSGFCSLSAAVSGVHSQVSTIDFVSTKVANGTLRCFHVIVFTEAKALLPSSLPVCDQPADAARHVFRSYGMLCLGSQLARSTSYLHSPEELDRTNFREYLCQHLLSNAIGNVTNYTKLELFGTEKFCRCRSLQEMAQILLSPKTVLSGLRLVAAMSPTQRLLLVSDRKQRLFKQCYYSHTLCHAVGSRLCPRPS